MLKKFAASLILAALFLAVIPWSQTWLQADGLPDRPDISLPDRPPLNPPGGGGDDSGSDGDRRGPLWAYIELQVQSPRPGLWTVVQWQDTAGNWHDVEGWRGQLDWSGWQRWAVAAKDFGDGPFRWLVVDGQNGPSLSASPAFTLPTGANQIVPSLVDLTAEATLSQSVSTQ